MGFGEVPDELRKIHDACMEVDVEINVGTVPGKTAGELYNLLTKAYTDRGFPEQMLQHHQGGLIGYKCRHWIAMPEGKQVIKAGHAYAWNPTIAGKTIGTKSEDTIIVDRDGKVKNITPSPTWPYKNIIASNGTVFGRP